MSFKSDQLSRAARLIEEGFFEGDPGGGIFMGQPRPSVLMDSLRNLYPAIREDALKCFEENRIAWWSGKRPAGHVLSSQISRLNHLFPARNDKAAVLGLFKSPPKGAGRFVDALPIPVSMEGFLMFEGAGGK